MVELKLHYQIKKNEIMKFIEIIQEIINKKQIVGSITDTMIVSEDLIPYYYHLSRCDMFKDCDLEFINDYKLFETQSKLEFHTMKLSREHKFTGRCVFDNIIIGPSVYIVNELDKAGSMKTMPSEKANISPSYYDPNTFIPYKVIKLYFSPSGDEDVTKAFLKMKLADVLDNPSKYETPSYHSILIRGSFTIADCKEHSSLHIRSK